MCVMAYTDGSVRVCVHTANLVESDWNNRVQGVWLSPLCPALDPNADSDAGESPTHFKRDIIQYLSAYRLPQLQPWIGKLRRADFSHIKLAQFLKNIVPNLLLKKMFRNSPKPPFF